MVFQRPVCCEVMSLGNLSVARSLPCEGKSYGADVLADSDRARRLLCTTGDGGEGGARGGDGMSDIVVAVRERNESSFELRWREVDA